MTPCSPGTAPPFRGAGEEDGRTDRLTLRYLYKRALAVALLMMFAVLIAASFDDIVEWHAQEEPIHVSAELEVQVVDKDSNPTPNASVRLYALKFRSADHGYSGVMDTRIDLEKTTNANGKTSFAVGYDLWKGEVINLVCLGGSSEGDIGAAAEIFYDEAYSLSRDTGHVLIAKAFTIGPAQ